MRGRGNTNRNKLASGPRLEDHRPRRPNWRNDGSDPANGTADAVEQTFAWGPDLSSTEQGAGGIGGLAVMLDDSFELGGGSGAVGHMFPVYDGNGNIVKVYSTEIQQDLMTSVAEYRYGPFGEQRGQSGSMATRLPFRWSTKFTDNETALVYYGYRYYSGSLGRWVSRDPLQEPSHPNLFCALNNSPLNAIDPDGRLILINADGNFWFQDDEGEFFFLWWMLSQGTTLQTMDGRLGNYMKRHDGLAEQIENKILADAKKRRTSGPVDIRFHAEVEDGYWKGYELLHGTNRDVGDFTIVGSVEASLDNDCNIALDYSLTHTWNDRMDPKFPHDLVGWVIAQGIAKGNGVDYTIRIGWNERCRVVILNDGRIVSKQGYPFRVPDPTGKRKPLNWVDIIRMLPDLFPAL